MKRIAIFASGTGTNALKILEYFQSRNDVIVSCILSNNCQAPVLNIASLFGVETKTFDRNSFYQSNDIIEYLQSKLIDLIVLAGFLWLIPEQLLKAYPNKIINIHPALLPSFGGKGMYGMHVHRAVKAAGVKESGISIHYVDDKYDEGDIIFQKTFEVVEKDTPDDIAHKIQALEHKYYPEIIDQILHKPS
ncbi:MAG TPA: phosphoribosylglycinamide formyltransferase [Saprospiraceae bacterium]|nr:phosphoribosylglycinamide formyltransferase [Saprospiraceae bacterium]